MAALDISMSHARENLYWELATANRHCSNADCFPSFPNGGVLRVWAVPALVADRTLLDEMSMTVDVGSKLAVVPHKPTTWVSQSMATILGLMAAGHGADDGVVDQTACM